MKLPGNKLKMSSGEIRKFGSAKKRANFERVAQAVKHGWTMEQTHKRMKRIMYGS